MSKIKTSLRQSFTWTQYQPLIEKWLWLGIIFLAILLRFWKIEYIPYANDADELAYIWAGQSLVQYGQPISWSSFSHTDTQWHWTEIPSEVVGDSAPQVAQFVRPWFDHSFVLPLMMGVWSHVLGYQFPEIPPALFYRLPFLVIAAVNLALIYVIAKKVFGRWPALLSLVIVAFSPSFLFAQRMVVSENVTSLFILLAIYFFFTKKPLWSIILATALAGLVKLPGLAILPVLAASLFVDKKYKQLILYVSGVTVLVVAGYLAYGASIDLPVFLSTMRDQSSRLLGWSNPAFILSQPGFHHKVMLDFSYYFVLLLGMSILFIPSTKETKILAGATLATYLTIWVTSAEQDMLGWYKLPLFFLLAINVAGIFQLGKQKVEEENPLQGKILTGVGILLLLMVANNFGLVRFPEQPLPEAQLLRVIVGGLLGGSLLALQVQLPKKVLVAGCVLALCLYVGQAAYVADQYFAASCKDRNCPTPFVTLRSVISGALSK